MSEHDNKEQSPRRIPGWMRIILFVLLFTAAGIAYYLNFQDIIEQMNE